LPIAFVLGWLASRFDLRQMRLENRQAPKAYFKGLNFLLNEQQDQAIDAFIEAVQNDPDTSELHFALGNLFRRRGEYERAVRVHEHLLSRADISADDRHRAQHGLALGILLARRAAGEPLAHDVVLAERDCEAEPVVESEAQGDGDALCVGVVEWLPETDCVAHSDTEAEEEVLGDVVVERDAHADAVELADRLDDCVAHGEGDVLEELVVETLADGEKPAPAGFEPEGSAK
jgi:tetratricopeptide (TPR) repeat protein